jgi:hypothetical protein
MREGLRLNVKSSTRSRRRGGAGYLYAEFAEEGKDLSAKIGLLSR